MLPQWNRNQPCHIDYELVSVHKWCKFPVAESGSFDENVIIAEKEIKDLSEILPDIRAKVSNGFLDFVTRSAQPRVEDLKMTLSPPPPGVGRTIPVKLIVPPTHTHTPLSTR